MQVKFNIIPSSNDHVAHIRKTIEEGLSGDVFFVDPIKNVLLHCKFKDEPCAIMLRVERNKGEENPVLGLIYTIPDNRPSHLLDKLKILYRSIHEYVSQNGGVIKEEYHFNVREHKAIKDWYHYESKVPSYHQFPWWCNWLDILGTSTGPAQVFGSSHTCTRESLLASLILYGNYKISFHQDFENLGGAAVGKIKFTGLPDDLNAHITKWAHEERSSQIQNFIAVTNSAKAMMLDSLHAFINKREM